MFPNLAFSALLFASVISALPYSNLLAVPIEPRQDPICPPTTEGQPYVARVHYYNDQGCADLASMLCLYVYQEVIDAAPGNAGCAAALIPDGPSIHARLEDTLHPNIHLAYTRDQSCPSTGAGAVFATLRNTRSCVRMSVPGSTGPGLAMFPNGGAGISRIAGVDQDRFFPNSVLSVSHTAGREALAKRRGSKCSGFRAENQMPTYSRSVQVSNIVDCINGNDSGCQITLGTERTESIATSFSTTAGGGIEGIFSVEATFGIEYTMSLTTSFSQGFTIPRGQKGYLAVYSAATLFTGKFTGCDSGDSEQAGQVVAIKKDSFTYGVILTGRKL